ncbi:gibberellin 2-beta-dioxygenase 1-like [Senna tora]|uniref:gibberellin 2beta-dioxygenase n=1 Tax=Senna tora TaxID=362788 RepID=A0A834X2M3_9FABA|nr:gibberellin 2-beta-dioxygenase 1-like [Senna tora]
MVVVSSKPAKTEQYSYVKTSKTTTFFPGIPVIDLKKPESKNMIVKACEEFGFFKVVNHGVPMKAICELESETEGFFSLPLEQKQKAGTPNPFGYGNKRIGRNGDVGWVEYLLLTTNHDYNSRRLSPVFGTNHDKFRSALKEYMGAVRKMACEVLELLAEGLKIEPKNVLSKLLMDKESDSIFRLNHYPPCPPHLQPNNNINGNGGEIDNNNTKSVVGFGEHTDPQIISLLRSNNTSGLQICLKDGSWVSVPPDHTSFFINVMSNGRFKSVRHRVLANGLQSRVSMIYFGGPPLTQTIAPLPSLMQPKDMSLYKHFTWFDYKKSAYASRLADNRLAHFHYT